MNGVSRSQTDKWISGVAGGIAKRFDISSFWVRLLFVLFAPAAATSLLLYIFLWILLPVESE